MSGERFQLSNLAPQYRRAGLIAALLFVTMFLPWYTRNGDALVNGKIVPIDGKLSAFQAFSFVEAAILLVAVSVLALLYVRGQRRPFHLPGGDGTIIAAAGVWVCALVLYRFIDNNDSHTSDVIGGGGTIATVDYGVTWGIFVTFFVGLLLVHAGLRIRAAHISEPPNPAAALPGARNASPLTVDNDTAWTEDEGETRVVRDGTAVDPLRYDDPY